MQSKTQQHQCIRPNEPYQRPLDPKTNQDRWCEYTEQYEGMKFEGGCMLSLQKEVDDLRWPNVRLAA